MGYTDIWWTAPATAENGNPMIVTGRDRIDRFMQSGKYTYRIEVIWRYDGTGMPDDETAGLMEQATDAMKAGFKKDPVAVMTGIYTGDGQRDWVFYTRSLGVFNKVFNRALESLPTLPVVVEAYSDPEWEEYRHLRQETYIPDED